MRSHAKASSAGSSAAPGREPRDLFGPAYRRALTTLALAVALLTALAFSASPALAFRLAKSQLTEANGTPFLQPWAVAVDDSDNLWVSDRSFNNGLIDKFDSAGSFLAQGDGEGNWPISELRGLAFSNASNHLYVADSERHSSDQIGSLWALNSDASFSSRFAGIPNLGFVATDNSGTATDGTVFAASVNVVFRLDGAGNPSNFSASASYISANQLKGTPQHGFARIGGVATDSAGNLYILYQVEGTSDYEVAKFHPSGQFAQVITGPFTEPGAIAIDPTNGNILVADGGNSANDTIYELDSSGALVDSINEFNGDQLDQIDGLAVDSAGTVYAADRGNRVVDVFGPAGSPPPKLGLEVAVSGAGTVNSHPTGISACTEAGGTCSAEFYEGSTLVLTASPEVHNKLVGWSGCSSEPSPNKCKVTMSAAKMVEAHFEPIPQQTLEVSVSGNGEVTSSPAGIACTSGPCSEHFDEASTVTLAATPVVHNKLVAWSGCDSTNGNECQVEMSAAKTVSAEFEPIPQQTLEVSVTGNGEVTSSPAGIACTSGPCSELFDSEGPGSEVTLTASPQPHNRILAWSGCDAEPSPTECLVTMSAAKSVSAEFEPIPQKTLSVQLAGSGKGHVSNLVPGFNEINCSNESAQAEAESVCSHEFDEGAFILLLASPSEKSLFAGWTNCPFAADFFGTPACVISIFADRTVEVEFEPFVAKISEEAARDVGPSSAKLLASVETAGDPTRYRFEYGPSTEYGKSAPSPNGTLPAGLKRHSVSVPLFDLKPATHYHYRFVAENDEAAKVGPDRTFTTLEEPSETGQALPSGRVWEQVSPQDKNGSDLGLLGRDEDVELPGLIEKIDFSGLTLQISDDGERISFHSNKAAFANPASGADGTYISKRSNSGWSTENIEPPLITKGVFDLPVYGLLDRSLSKIVYRQAGNQPKLTPDAPDHYRIYARNIDDGTFHLLHGLPADVDEEDFELQSWAGSDDLSHFAFRRYTHSPGVYEAYEDENGDYQTRYASFLPDGTPAADAALGGGRNGPLENSVSRDGSRILFSVGANLCFEFEFSVGLTAFDSCGGLNGQPTPIYVREDATTSRPISDYAPGVPPDPEGGTGQHFWGADRDMKHVFFTSQTELTADSTASTGSFGDLYRYDLEANGGAGELHDITVDSVDPEGAQVIGVLGNSDDAGRIYFVARSNQLDGEQGVPGEANLYLWDYNGGSPTTTYIATLQPGIGDEPNWLGFSYNRSSEVTPDGDHILFSSKNSLTDFASGGRNEVYVYDATTDQLQCASCGGSEPAAHDAFVPYSNTMKLEQSAVHTHPISSDGRWVFFNTAEALVARDTNGQIDPYEFDTETGKVALLSSGRDGDPSYFLGASLSGKDAFFLTRSKLVSQDTDDILDIYDARVGGGIAGPNKPAVPCEGEACQPPPVVPNDPTPASAGFSGAGNQNARKAKKHHRKHKHKRRRHERRGNPTHRHG